MMKSSKRSKGVGSCTSENIQCLVDGCNADLSQCRDYHRRHKVCEFHSKSPTVTIATRESRFCQQCSRFHSLVEFDDVKRSCRKRLDGHNKRRRKPQPELRNGGLVLTSQQVTGSRLVSFTIPQICPNDVTVKTENNNQTNWSSSSNNCRASSSSSFSSHHIYNGGLNNHFQFMQQNNEPCDRGQSNNSTSSNNQKRIFSESALSLLSSQSAPLTMEVGFNPMHHRRCNEFMSSSQSQTAQVGRSSQFSGGNRFLFGTSDVENNKPVVSERDDSHFSSNASFQFQEMFQNGPDESFGSGSHQTLAFIWD